MDNNFLPVVQEDCSTLNQLIDISCSRFAEQPAIGSAFEKAYTYQELREKILLVAVWLQKQGVGRGDKVAVLAESSPVWGVAYFAIVRLGGVVVPILPDLPEADVHNIMLEMECKVSFTSQKQVDKLYEIADKTGVVVTLDDYEDDSGLIGAIPFTRVIKKAEDIKGEKKTSFDFPPVESDELAVLLYTSGTSGFSKAVMLSHANLCANAYSTVSLFSLRPGSVVLSILPIAHTYEFTVGFLVPIIKGARIVYAGKTPTPAILGKICAHEKPHMMLVVPLVMEKIYKKRVVTAIEKSKLLSWCCRIRSGRKFIHKKIGRRLLNFFGGRLEVMGIGGAALNPEVEQFLFEADFPYLVGYGMTEASPLISGGPQGDKNIPVGSIGKPIPKVEVRIEGNGWQENHGEIQVSGPNVMQGYWQDEEATREVFTEDGWLKTGDIGFMDEDGYLYIRGRSKSVIVLANGENVYPEAIEHKLNRYPMVMESLVLENRGMIEAWVYPDYELLEDITKDKSRSERHLYLQEQLALIKEEINNRLSVTSRISRIVERREPFIKTATHKIKRYLYSGDNIS